MSRNDYDENLVTYGLVTSREGRVSRNDIRDAFSPDSGLSRPARDV